MRGDTGGNGDQELGSGRGSARGSAKVQPAGSVEAGAQSGGMLAWCVCFGKKTGPKVSVCVCLCVHLQRSMYVCVCVRMCDRDRERE